MPDRPFPILGATVPQMLGRGAIMKRMIDALVKPTPDHLQVVGPRFGGKTVTLHELANRLRSEGRAFNAVLLWDLRHQTPLTDELFMKRFALELSGALGARHANYAEYLKDADGAGHQEIGEVLDLLKAEGHRVLIIMDQLDKPLSNGNFTRNLWDQLRELALRPSLRLVTSSRAPLRELIRQPDAQASDFWGIFEPRPVRVGCFDHEDLAIILGRLADFRLSPGAQTELWNAANGFPVMTLEVLNTLCAVHSAGDIDQDAINRCSEETFPSLIDKLHLLWSDCSPSSQDLLKRVVEDGPVSRTGLVTSDVNSLVEKGFAREVDGKLQKPSRLLSRYLNDLPNEGATMARLFGPSEACKIHFKSALQHRVAQIQGMDARLHRYLETGAQDFPDHPSIFLTHVRGIIDYAFELIWKAELPMRVVPSEWIEQWKFEGDRANFEGWKGFPQGRARLRLLDLMTGSDKSERVSKFVTKSTYVLLNAANSFGDFGQHQEGLDIDTHMAYAGLHLCIELAATLCRELPTA